MKGLLIKDFNLLKKRGIFFLVFIVGYTVYQLGTFNSEAAVGFATLMIAVFSLTTITYDEYENGMPFLFTLPFRRVDYVREKYVFGFLSATITWIIMGAACFLFDILIWKEDSGEFLRKLVFCVSYLIVVYFIVSLQIALKLKFAERSGTVMMIFAAIIGVFGSIAYIQLEYGERFVILSLNWNIVVPVAVAVLFALMFGLYRWSVGIMEKREF
ncbi:MAG: ABC-2 transporter permease [Lachnospiraceae bacterium]|nr:ABC-2 transporter permease [Lachnospiraceae bacterium]